jgi:hypothetical protein
MYLTQSMSGGIVTNNSRTLAPVYQWGGTPSITAGQLTFNIQQMTMYLGNGATATAVNEVVIGEVTVAGAVVTAIVWYALLGRYDSGWTNTLPVNATIVSKNHNIGVQNLAATLFVKCLTAEQNWLVDDVITRPYNYQSGSAEPVTPITTRLTAVWATLGAGGLAASRHRTPTNVFTLTLANWAYRITVQREW